MIAWLKKWIQGRLLFYYAIISFGVMFVSVAIVVAIFSALIMGGYLELNWLTTMLGIAGTCTLIGTIFSVISARLLLAPVIHISDASIRVAQGDFTVSLSEKSHIREIHTTCRNFNAMVQELNTIETLRNDFVANVSHEFKTPITAIEGYAMLLQDDTLSEELRQDYIEKILNGTNRLSTLVSSVLMLSKLENQGYSGEKNTFMMDELIRRAILHLENRWTDKQIEFDIEMIQASYEGWENLLLQAWINLIGNAIKFSPANSVISIHLFRRDGRLQVVIRDRGIGMDANTMRHIFEKFYQGDTSHRTQGNGLGLSLVRTILNMHNASITVESAPGKGSTFTVIL